MTDEGKAPEQAAGTPAQTTPPQAPPQGQEQWTREQQADYTRKMQAYSEMQRQTEMLDEKAQAEGFTDHAEMVEWTAQQLAAQREQQGDVYPPERTVEDDQFSKFQREYKSESESRTAREAKLHQRVMANDFQIAELSKPEDKRSSVSVGEIDKRLKTDEKLNLFVNYAATKQQSGGGEGNIYKIAAGVIEMEKTNQALMQQGAKNQEALSDAEKAAQLGAGVAPPPKPDGKDEPSLNDELANKIAPDTRRKF